MTATQIEDAEQEERKKENVTSLCTEKKKLLAKRKIIYLSNC